MTPEESEALIEAIARGDVPVDDEFAAAMSSIHIRPAEAVGQAPAVDAGVHRTVPGLHRSRNRYFNCLT